MLKRNALPTSSFFMVVLVALATVGVGYGLWSKVLTIEGTVNTGDVNAAFNPPFTDDDDDRNDPTRDAGDTGNCLIGSGSCDPKETGAEIDTPQAIAAHRYDKGVASCVAGLAVIDPDSAQVGNQGATVTISEGYPSYHCTAWFPIVNNGTIPVNLHGVEIEGDPAVRCEDGSLPYNLDGQEGDDVEICVSGLASERQIDPISWDPQGDPVLMDLDIHLLQAAPQGEDFSFSATVCLHQWNVEPEALQEDCFVAALPQP